jgi:hypothetical protein
MPLLFPVETIASHDVCRIAVEKMHAHPRTAVQYCHKHRFPALPFEAFAYFMVYFRYWAELNNLLLLLAKTVPNRDIKNIIRNFSQLE